MKSLAMILIGGLLFGFGIAMSGLTEQEVVLSFLYLDDLGLGVTMAGALLVTVPIYQLTPRLRKRPLLGESFERFPRRVTSRNVIGGVLFGVGWGVSGVCPGAAIASLGAGNWPILAALAGMLVGAYIQGVFFVGTAAGLEPASQKL